MKRITSNIGLFSIATLGAAMITAAAGAQTIGIATSGPGSITHSSGSALAKLITQDTGMQARVQPHSGNSATVPAVNAGEVDFALANEFELQFATTGTGIYKGQKLTNLRVAGIMMPLRTTFFVQKDSPIKSIKDLKGKRVPGKWSAQKVIGFIANGYLANGGISYKDVKMVPVPNVVRGADDFSQGKADVFFFAVGSGKTRQAGAKVGGLRALPVDPSPEAMARFRKFLPVVYASELKPSKVNYGITEPTYVAAFDLTLITNNKMSEDAIYKIMKAIHGGKKKLFASFKPLGANFSPNRMAKKLPRIDYHPGAIKFYKEIGQWPPKG
ncbi:MAG: TAXI family TRAP transporter solute-binding subunit [Rhodospirillales bacterium]|nr:TAXI family TRAP transporter solute-binding subunit [Rhodospirillales bacterium]